MSGDARSSAVAWRDPADVTTRVERDELVLVDVRPPRVFATGHPAGAINVAYSPRRFAERVATVQPTHAEVVVVGADPDQLTDAARQLLDAGRPVAALVAADRARWEQAGARWATLDELTVADLTGAGAALAVVDVREPVEWDTGHVPGALLLPLGDVRDHLDQLSRDRRIAVICESGARSATAASLLRAHGFRAVANVIDGTAAYRRSGRPLATPRGPEP